MDDSLDPIQDIFQQFERQASHSNSAPSSHQHSTGGYSSGHSHSGQSDVSNEGDYSYDSDALLSYMAQVQEGLDTSNGGAGLMGRGIGPLPGGGHQRPEQLYAHSLSPASVISSVSSPAYPYSLPSKGNSPFDFNGASPPFSLNPHDYSVATNLTSSSATGHFYSPHYPDARSSAAALGQNGAHPQQQQQPIPYSSNYTPQTGRPLSPPSSTSSSNGGFNPAANSNFVHNEAIARMIAAHGQAQAPAPSSQSSQSAAIGQAQVQAQALALAQVQAAQAQAAYAASYMANLNARPPVYNNTTSANYAMDAAPAIGGSTTYATEFDASPLGNSSLSSADGGDAKKRRVSPSVLARGPAAKGLDKKATSTTTSMYPMAVDEDSFSLKHGTRSAPTVGNARSSIDVIANAGIAPSADTRKGSRDEAVKAASTIRAAAPAVTRSVPAAAAKGTKADKKAPPKKAEKRKKGEKGHNAVERRYRNNINNAIATLRDIVPALRHLKPLPSMPASRRRASQFTLSTAAQAPTPAGLIDGIPAAKTLSKGTILGKSIEYISFLQESRVDAEEDIEIFKLVVNEMVAGGSALIEAFEQRRAIREVEREKSREIARKEQALLDEEDNSDEEEDEEDEKAPSGGTKRERSETEEKAPVQQTKQQQQQQQQSSTNSSLHGLAQLRHHLASNSGGTLSAADMAALTAHGGQFASSGSPNGLPSPVSSEDLTISPRIVAYAQQHRGHVQGPPRYLLASFMGLTFAGGLGYDWTYGMAEEVMEDAGARAWAGRLVRRAATESSGPSPLISSEIVHPALLTALLFLGLASVIASAVFLLYPLFAGPSEPTPESIAAGQSRNAYRQRRRADALASLAELNGSVSDAPSYRAECESALKARKELLRLVGAPTYGFLPALAKEALATAVRKMTTMRVGSFSTWPLEDRVEAAVAWVRIAEIEATIADSGIGYLARCYTFLRLFNLSRSSSWPETTSSTTRPAVNAILALQLAALGQPTSAHALWNQAANADRKKSDIALDPWVEIAISTNFEKVRAILAAPISPTARASPSDTVPLLKISESRCEAALRETWAKIFVAVAQTTCPSQAPLSPMALFSTIVDQPLLEDTMAHVLASTADGTVVHTMAKVTRALCAFYTGDGTEARSMAQALAHEVRRDGPMSRLACAAGFFALILDNSSLVDPVEPASEVDILASTTLGWLTVRRQSQILLSSTDASKSHPALHATTLSVRRLLGSQVFYDPALVAFCASSAGGEGGEELDLESAQEACVDALTEVTRRAAGLGSAESDSGIECE